MCWLIYKPKMRVGLLTIAKAFFRPPIIATICALSLYASAVICTLYYLGLWSLDQLKDSVFWLIGTVIALISQFSELETDDRFFHRQVQDQFKLAVLIEFFGSLRTFNLAIELTLPPVMFFIGGMIIVAGRDEAMRRVQKFLTVLLFSIGLAMLLSPAYWAVTHLDRFLALGTARDFYTGPLLSLLLIPFLLGLKIYSLFERVWGMLYTALPSRASRSYAILCALFLFRFNPDQVLRWGRNVLIHGATSIADIHRSINTASASTERRLAAPQVLATAGWNPYQAEKFLAGEGLLTGQYHDIEGEWWAGSGYLSIGISTRGSHFMSNNIAYYISGEADAAKCLKIAMNANDPIDTLACKTSFLLACRTLVLKACGAATLSEWEATVATAKHLPIEMIGRLHKIRLSRSEWSSHIEGGYTEKFAVSTIGFPSIDA